MNREDIGNIIGSIVYIIGILFVVRMLLGQMGYMKMWP